MKSISLFVFEKLNPFNVWIMVGLPGSGKSTWIENNLPNGINIINQDSIRVELGIMKNVNQKRIGNNEQEKQVSSINNDRIEKFIKNREDFVIDNTNVKAGRVEQYYKRLKKSNANVHIILVDTDPETCKKRRKEDIPEKVIDDMYIGISNVKDKFKNNKDFKIVHNK